MPVNDLGRETLYGAGQIKAGSPIDSGTLRALATKSNGRLIAGRGIRIKQSGSDYLIEAVSQMMNVAGGLNITHYDTFPAIPSALTLIELGGLIWHAMTGDTVWNLSSFVASEATGEVGTDITGSAP